MLLVIDVGNTNIVFGVYDGDELAGHWRIATNPDRTTDETGILLHEIFNFAGIDIRKIRGSVISSVVPPVLHPVTRMCERYFRHAPLVVGPGIKTGISILYDNPKEVGADRIVNAVAAHHMYPGDNCVVVDFGTATTFDYVTRKGEYLGGVISPGLQVALNGLFSAASKLPRVEIAKPTKILGKNTVHAIQAGIFYGYVGLVDGIVNRLREEQGDLKARVLATGGLSSLIAQESKTIEEVDAFLTLFGLKLIYEMNR
ncbi:MAG: type III pantothenate kinase [Deltaproteobacteria bacterium]|nr:type III pantothenate kinase [Deltaproteobacteria bacterium]